MNCAHCGKPPIFENTVTEAVVKCVVCLVAMVERHDRGSDEPAIERITERWNRRVTRAENW